MTHKYIGTKIITAWAAVGKDGAPGYVVKYEDGYTSWSPKAQFEAAYRDIEGPVQALTFGDALHMLKLGKRVARSGWNGKGMWLKLVPADLADKIAFEYAALNALPWIGMKTADEKFVPWLASQTDVLAEDWMVIE